MTKRILIIGAGVTGLTTALVLKRADPSLDVVIYDSSPGIEAYEHQILWKGGIHALLDLNLGKRLSRIVHPVTNITSTDVESGELLVHLEPGDSTTEKMDNLPPMVVVRRCDLIRLLLTALAGRDDLVSGSALNIAPPNNGDQVEVPVEGIEADLSVPNWYEDQGFAEMLPFLKFEHKLESLRFSAETGKITALFSNGLEDTCFMLIGCDGTHSTVRSFIANDRIRPQHAMQCFIHGVTDLQNLLPKIDDVKIESFTKEQFLEAFPEKSTKTWHCGEIQVGVTNYGNEIVGWNLLVPQDNPGELAEAFVVPRRREVIGNFQLGTENIAPVSIISNASPDSTTNWQVPATSTLRESLPFVNLPGAHLPSAVFAQLGTENLDGNEARDLALASILKLNFPAQVKSLLASSDIYQTYAADNMDFYNNQLEWLRSYTSPTFHPGKLLVLGDAACTLANNVVGNHGLSICLNDAVAFGKIFEYYFSPNGRQMIHDKIGYSTEEHVTECIAKKLTESRLSDSYNCMKLARQECKWSKKPVGFFGSLIGSQPQNWPRSNFDEMMMRGRTKLDLQL